MQSSAVVELTEAETEYAVNVVKHIYPGHIVFQFNCTNTIAEQLLENVITFGTPSPVHKIGVHRRYHFCSIVWQLLAKYH